MPNIPLLQLDSLLKPYHGIDPDRQTEKDGIRYLVLAEVSSVLKAIIGDSIEEAVAVAGCPRGWEQYEARVGIRGLIPEIEGLLRSQLVAVDINQQIAKDIGPTTEDLTHVCVHDRYPGRHSSIILLEVGPDDPDMLLRSGHAASLYMIYEVVVTSSGSVILMEGATVAMHPRTITKCPRQSIRTTTELCHRLG